MESIVLGGGCFWCLEATYQLVFGVEKVIPGYAGGTTKNPNYYDLQKQNTGHTEVVKIEFDNSKITLENILQIFWIIHDPTTLNRQGADVGEQYRSIILFSDEDQKEIVEMSINQAQDYWNNKIVTEVKKLDRFYEAEQEHHNYFNKHPELAYCQLVINPKLAKLRKEFPEKLKK